MELNRYMHANIALKAPQASARYRAELAVDQADVRLCQTLRYRVFAGEMGARLHSLVTGLDCDELDAYCDHLLVRDTESNAIVACTRLLSDSAAAALGHFYSETEFELTGIRRLPGRLLEIGRTCVDPAHRGSIVLSTLWNGLAEYVSVGRFGFLMGCASITPGPHGFSVDAVYRQLGSKHLGSDDLGVRSKRPVPAHLRCHRDESGIPPLLLAYLRLGCKVLGDPYWDEDFNVMDLFILLDLTQIQSRYEKRFMGNKGIDSHAATPSLV